MAELIQLFRANSAIGRAGAGGCGHRLCRGGARRFGAGAHL